MPTRILIADDNQVLRRRLAELIENHDGWEVCASVENGQQTVERAAELKPDLIVLDLAMPVMNGLQAAREIANILPSVPMLIYTLHNSAWVELEAKNAGARRVVFKPDVGTLLKTIEEFIQKKAHDVASVTALDPGSAARIEPPAANSEPTNQTGETETPLAASGESDAPLS